MRPIRARCPILYASYARLCGAVPRPSSYATATAQSDSVGRAFDNGSVVTGLVLIGAPGAGKSSVLEALTTRLEVRGTAYGAIESEQLAWGWPLLGAESWIAQLAAVIGLQRQSGRTLFLIAATTETADQLRGVLTALNADVVLVVCLIATPKIVAARIEEREPDRWPGKERLIRHARELARTIPLIETIDLQINTEDREADDVAAEIHDALITLGID